MPPKANQTNASSVKNETPAYNPAEKAYVKENFKSEFHMLRDYGLSIYKEEDREEGRQIARGFMKQDEEDKKK